MGSELFTRTGRGIKPTRFAVELYEHVQEHILGIDKIIEGLANFEPESSRRRFVIYCHEAALLRLHKRMHVFEKYPNISLVLKELPPNDARIYEDLRMEKVDLVIDVAPSDSRVFQSKLLHSDGLICIASATHPRLQDGKMTKQRYMDENHVLLNIRRENLTFVEWLVSDVLPPRKVFSQHSSYLVCCRLYHSLKHLPWCQKHSFFSTEICSTYSRCPFHLKPKPLTPTWCGQRKWPATQRSFGCED
ncbi:transcriptional regulator LysR family [Vibrio variabilis]|uniref:Transcriptional regulator LysR family n=1 Tax=Vibrio variabilis TaxID=990271 RepID=A0ABQ0JD69_9VIBR|nr:transcriptional regulator LysR family [Vibrio variabilis]